MKKRNIKIKKKIRKIREKLRHPKFCEKYCCCWGFFGVFFLSEFIYIIQLISKKE